MWLVSHVFVLVFAELNLAVCSNTCIYMYAVLLVFTCICPCICWIEACSESAVLWAIVLTWHSPKFVLWCQIKSDSAARTYVCVCFCQGFNNRQCILEWEFPSAAYKAQSHISIKVVMSPHGISLTIFRCHIFCYSAKTHTEYDSTYNPRNKTVIHDPPLHCRQHGLT